MHKTDICNNNGELRTFPLISWFVFYICRATSATSHVVLGQFKTCVILLGGYFIFNSDPGFVSICGAITALIGMSVYTSLNLQESGESSSKQLPTPVKPKDEESTELDIKDSANVV